MTWIVHGAKTKKELREKLMSCAALGIAFEDPAFMAPQWIEAHRAPIGFKCVATNHPKRSWFAAIERTANGWRVE